MFIIDRESGMPVLRASKDIAGNGLPEYSRNIVDEVVSSGKSIVISSASSDSSFKSHRSVLLAELKSVMCIPIRFSSRITGVYYLDNPLTTGVFSEDDARLLDALLMRASKHLQTMFESPHMDSQAPHSAPQEVKIAQIIQYIAENYSSDISRESLAEEFGLNPDYLGKIFKAATGKKIGEYINERRIKNAAEKLSSTDALIIDIAYSTGFESLRTFNRAFKKEIGLSPTEYREKFFKKNKGTNIIIHCGFLVRTIHMQHRFILYHLYVQSSF